ncbi:Protein CBG02683 [Caenorhabditis briggsae]|uniref:Protein CBG02683 n=1 Tax=Caenorhabditis briggsae TaxID=6238 RepID=A8WTR5_CAEBR|nr:Protein CBG02683 [Caenorhabditis briggsae]CAP23877.2 Protein CBG02683 [Caenorhabditis briggsae]
MQVLRQLPHQHQLASSPSSSCDIKSIYASEKVRDAIRDHEQAIATSSAPKNKAKVVVLGDSGVGKTSIIYRHRYGAHYRPVNATIGASFVSFDVGDARDDMVRLQVWDTAGQERFRCMVPMYMRNAEAALIVYDVTDRSTFEDVEKWLKDLDRSSGTEDANVFLIANKTDLTEKREVSEFRILTKYSNKFKFIHFPVFAAILSELAEDVLQSRQQTSEKKQELTLIRKDNVALAEDKFDDNPNIQLKSRKSKCCSML